MKKLWRLCATLALTSALALAVDFSALKPEGCLSDFARVVPPGQKNAFEQYCASLEAATGVQLALVTLPTLAGEPIEDVANLLYRKWGVGKKDTNEGALLLLSIQDRRSRLEVGYGMEPYVPDGYAGSLLRQMRPALRDGRYGDALLEAAQMLGTRVAEAKNVKLEPPVTSRKREPKSADVPWPLILGGLFLLLWMLGSGGRRRGFRGSGKDLMAAWLLSQLLGRGGPSGRSSGGFGGFDSFDSFGGFGGGDSGGGGASSSW